MVDLPAELCVVGGGALDAEAALRSLSALALSHGYVREGHADALVEREKEFPTGLPMPLPLAIPHADASWVRRPCLAAYVPARPITFAEMGRSEAAVEARLVLMLAVDDPQEQVPLLGRLLRALRRPDLEAVLLKDLEGPADLSRRFARVLSD